MARLLISLWKVQVKQMHIELTVKRQTVPDETSYLQTFSYDGDAALTIADWLTEVNRTEAKTNRIAWECGCLEKKCGACAMRINGIPRLACSVFLKDVVRHGKILLEPLSKFPLVKDLIVDRSSMFETLKRMRIWMQEKEDSSYAQDCNLQYQAGQCLQCGCCLEICPNFLAGGDFAGAAAMIEAYKAVEQNEADDHRAEMIVAYRKYFFFGCGQSLSCCNVCPMELPLDEMQVRLNNF